MAEPGRARRPARATLGVAAACLVLLVGLVVLRRATGLEVKLGDLALPATVFGLYLLLTGQITRIEAGGVTLERAFAEAVGSSLGPQVALVAPLPVDTVDYWQKGGPATLDRMLEEGAEALSFRFGHGGYHGPAIQEYLDALLARGAIRWVLFMNEDRTFWGLAEATALKRALGHRLPANRLAETLNAGERAPLAEALAGLVPAGAALAPDAEKRAALAAMEERSVDVLPVVDASGAFVGVVERSRLVASILLEVDRTLAS